MKTLKIMSIIGIVWLSLSLLCIITLYEDDLEASSGWGVLGMFYAIPFSIVVLINSNKNGNINPYTELLKLSELKEKGIISDEEFNLKKVEILNS